VMHLKIPLSSRDLKLSNSKPGYKVSVLHLFAKKMPPMISWNGAHFRWVLFSVSYHVILWSDINEMMRSRPVWSNVISEIQLTLPSWDHHQQVQA
jgi:hypothetical protein